MRILIIGGGGTIGRKVAAALGSRHEIVAAGRSGGDVRVDITEPASIRAMFEALPDLDACIATAASGGRDDFPAMLAADMLAGLNGKLYGQINLVLIGQHFLRDGGRFTLTSGMLSEDPAPGFMSGAVISGALDAFVRAAALELPRGQRVNAVSPGMVEDSLSLYGESFPGYNAVPMGRLINAYVKTIESGMTGQILREHG
ncbi:short chain dehydrogenase [Rhizobium leguminosarum]|uniref:short chain dehydrogenase n=1 Tax=Rhizobium leguminosarum TaxID=384 RepID=UPI001AE1C833|nr:short chain dehydrogenase [Rhizobium leguminosarum]MBP2443669.1 NAD(P)-dependent dehydrogenase (short-subunit alcohol dehydrogenase family) [Rhizobium leguminosarum]